MSRFTNVLWKTAGRTISLSLLISLLMLGGQAAAARNTVSMWVFPLLVNQSDNEALWGGLAQRFEKQNPDIDIQVEVLPWAGRDAKLTAALLGGQGPDVTYLIPDQIPQYVNLGVLEPLD
ncbi:MAG: extracellular solute-binding protein, partial [Bacillota bacterium]